ncbi:MAG: helix-turn-helix transcriptional regulator [Pseudomonadota bacterium]
MPEEFAKQISGFKSFDDAVDALEHQLISKYGQSGFAFWAFPTEAFNRKSRKLNPQNYPAHVTFRGPSYLKVAELLYMSHQSYSGDETMIASCERTEPFSSKEILKGNSKGKNGGFDILGFFDRFKITGDWFFPFHTSGKYQVLWTFKLGGNQTEGIDSDQLAKMKLLAARFIIAVSEYNITNKADLSDPKMSAREYQCLSLIARGLSNDEIAGELSISPDTVKFHVSKVMRKLGANNRTDTIAKAARSGWLTN